MKLNELKSSDERASFLAKKLNISLKGIHAATLDSDEDVHCENRIGSVQIPVGVAGPFHIKGEYAKGEFFVPLATTEGALVASVNRGAKASLENSIITSVERVGTTRGPVLKAKTIGGAKKIEDWIWGHMDELAKKAEETSSHIKLMDVMIRKVGLYVFVRLAYDTDRAMGMNMATIATQHIVEYVASKTNSELIAVAGNFDIDKKPAWLNSISGRGFVVNAEAIISKNSLITILKTNAQRLTEVWKAKCLIGSAISGSIGFNAHHANIVAAFYVATGQDLAHVVEGSLGMTVVEQFDVDSLYISVHLPCIMVGTMGGGTKLKTQQEALSILKTDSAFVLSEILGGAVLAGELSLLASLSEGTLASSHKKLGR